MTDDTLIADLIRAGVSPELVSRVANAIALSGTLSGTSIGAVRQYERNRKQEWRDKRRELQGKPEANDAGGQTVAPATMSRTVPDKSTNNESIKDSKSLFEKERVSQESKKVLVERARGTRISCDWQPSPNDQQFAADHGVRNVGELVSEFIDYWISVPGQRGTKLDWSAVWRNRVRQVGTNGHHKRTKSLASAADDLIARAESFERENDLVTSGDVWSGDAPSKTARR